jgi:hypothetical protein
VIEWVGDEVREFSLARRSLSSAKFAKCMNETHTLRVARSEY